MGQALSRAEQVAVVQRRLLQAQEDEEIPEGCSLYVLEGNFNWTRGTYIYCVCPDKDTTAEEDEFLREMAEGTDLEYAFTHLSPEAGRILKGAHLAVTTDVVRAAKSFLEWWQEEEELSCDENSPVLILPGAFVIGQEDSERDTLKIATICFPASAEPFGSAELEAQALFATTLVNRVGRNMDVVINGFSIEGVFPQMQPKNVLGEYRRRFGNTDKAAIPGLMHQQIARLRARLDELEAWGRKSEEARSFLPEGMQVLDASNGILVSIGDDDGLLILAADDEDDLPTSLLEAIREEILED